MATDSTGRPGPGGLGDQDPTARLARLERDLHDATQARLVALTMMLDLAVTQLVGDRRDGSGEDGVGSALAGLVAAARDEARESVAELRALLSGARPTALEDTLETALAGLAARSVVPVRLTVDLPDRVAPRLRDVVYFCTAELLTNVVRHSGARRATVEVTQSADRLRLTVTDDGVGGAAPREGHRGMLGLTTRVSAVGGSLRVDSPAGGPTAVEILLPAPLDDTEH